jgi:hypothetical protein
MDPTLLPSDEEDGDFVPDGVNMLVTRSMELMTSLAQAPMRVTRM